MHFYVPKRLAETCSREPERAAWLSDLPHLIDSAVSRWSLKPDELIGEDEGSCAYVLAVAQKDGTPAVLKFGMPHMEGEHEIAALRFWNGDGAVRLLAADEARGVMLLERCLPGIPLRQLPEPEQDIILARLLRRLWRRPPDPHPFRPLAHMTAAWAAETEAESVDWVDPGLVRAGLDLFSELPRTAPTEVLLATDLHAGNVLKADREPWLVIDPKPFVGDPAYDATQHLFNCFARLSADPEGTVRRFSDLLEVDYDRVRLWTFARAAAEWTDEWADAERASLARKLAP